jgi:hypothetical protein
MIQKTIFRQADDDPRFPRDTIVVITGTLVFCAIGVVLGLSLPTNHDEFQYIAAAHLYGKHDIYREFFYSQPPYFPIALYYWNSLFSDLIGSVYVSSRLFNVGWTIVFVSSSMYVLARVSPNAILAIGIFAILYFSKTLDLPLRVVRNDMMPLALTSVALALVSRRHFHTEHERWGFSHILAGVLLAAAVSSKHSYAVVALGFAISSLIGLGVSTRDSWKRATLPLVVGGFVGACPLLYYVTNNWTTMRFSLIEFHQTAHIQWILGQEPEVDFSMMDRIFRLAQELYNISFLAVLVILAFFFIAILVSGAGIRKSALFHWRMLSLSILTIALIIPTLLLIGQVHAQYLAPFIPFVGVCIVAAAGILDDSADWSSARLSSRVVFAGAGVFLIAAALYDGLVRSNRGAVAHLRSMLIFTPVADNPITFHRRNFREVWAAEHSSRVARRLVDVLGERRGTLRIATLMSSYPIEAGYDIYPEFAGSPFFYLSNDHLSPAERIRYVGVSPLTVRNWLEEANAEALLVGYHKGVETGFWDYAQERRFACFRVNLSGAYNFYAEGSREAYLLVLPSRTHTTPDCQVGMVTRSAESAGDR